MQGFIVLSFQKRGMVAQALIPTEETLTNQLLGGKIRLKKNPIIWLGWVRETMHWARRPLAFHNAAHNGLDKSPSEG